MEKIYNQLYYVYEKEKLDFFVKYVMKDKKYDKEELILLKKDLEELIFRLESFFNIVNEKYNFRKFNDDFYGDDYVEYLYMNEGLYYSDLYEEFITNAVKRVELIKYVLKEEISEETKNWLYEDLEDNINYLIGKKKDDWYDYNESGHKIINFIDSAFKCAEISARTNRKVDINFVKSFIFKEDLFLSSKDGILFYGEECNKCVDEFLESINKKRYYEIEIGEDDPRCSKLLLDELYNDICEDFGPEIIVVIKNIDNCVFDDDLNKKLLVFLSNLSSISGLTFFFTSSYPYCLDNIEKLANITIRINNGDCYYIL